MDSTKKGYNKESNMIEGNVTKQNSHLTQHKRFVPYGTHPNPDEVGTPFMLRTLGEIDKEAT